MPRTESVSFFIPVKTVSEANSRGHWRLKAARAKAQRAAATLLANIAIRGLKLPLTVELTRESPGTLDDDNLRPALKAVRDGIADSLAINDRDPRVKWKYSQRVAKEYGVYVRVKVSGGKKSTNKTEPRRDRIRKTLPR